MPSDHLAERSGRPSVPVRFPAVAIVPFAALAAVVARFPFKGDMLPWWQGALHAAALLGLVAAHATCYERWHPRAPTRILVNEFLARMWFLLYALLVVDHLGGRAGWYVAMGAPWAVLTWLVHRDQVAKRGYQWAEAVAILGLFLAGLAIVALLTLQPAT
jgi:hypothetical protein